MPVTSRWLPLLSARLEERPPGRAALAVALGGLTGFGALAVRCSHAMGPVLVDDAVDRWLTPAPGSWREHAAVRLVSLASPPSQIMAGAVLALAVLLLSRSLRWSWIVLLAPAVAGLAEILAKHAVRRAPLSGASTVSAAASSFPSGHATGAGARAAVVVLLVCALTRSRAARWAVALAAGAAALAVGLSLVAAHNHYVSDVAGGFLLAVPAVLLTATVILRQPTEECTAEPSHGRRGPGPTPQRRTLHR